MQPEQTSHVKPGGGLSGVPSPQTPQDLGRGVLENQEALGFLLAQRTEFAGSLSEPSGAPELDPDSAPVSRKRGEKGAWWLLL